MKGPVALAWCVCLLFSRTESWAIESLWIEAEHLRGIQGYCWPMQKPGTHKATGFWGLSGPGWAAEWNQGGESGFLSIACAPDEDKAAVSIEVEIPTDGRYRLWVRYGDWREKTNRFQMRIDQEGEPSWAATYGEHGLFDEDNMMKLFWNWAFGWEGQEAPLKKGKARLTLLAAFQEEVCRQVDCLVLTTDPGYRPWIKERPRNYCWEVLEPFRTGFPPGLEPLASRIPPPSVPESWLPITFKNQGFLYLQNTTGYVDRWAGDDPKRIAFPYTWRIMTGEDHQVLKEFEERYGGRKDVPIFSDPRVVPVFHGSGPTILQQEAAPLLLRWLDQHPGRPWASMMNYHPDVPMSESAFQNFMKYRDRYIGSISGENLGYFGHDGTAEEAAFQNCKTRRELAEALGKIYMAGNAAKWRQVYGRDIDNPYQHTMPAGVGPEWFPLCYAWGSPACGTEMVAVTGNMHGLFMALLRGAARQNKAMFFSYRSGNFGDSSADFGANPQFNKPGQIFDNFYGVYSGAGMTWWKLDGWYLYMAGSAMFYQEGGGDNFWKPGGLTAAGQYDVQLSPRGKLDDRLLRLTLEEPDRGVPVTPVAILLDYAHGWSATPYWPSLFRSRSERWTYVGNPHVRNIHEVLWLAYHPIGPRSQEPLTALTETFVPGVFGDIFDVIYAYPDVDRWDLIDTYSVVIVGGDIELTKAEGKRLKKYLRDGGTLMVAEGQLGGPGAEELDLPKLGEIREAEGYRWMDGPATQPSQRYRFRPVQEKRVRTLAATPDGQPLCIADEQGKGRLVFLSVPYGLGIDQQAVPMAARLLVHLTRGVMPLEVDGDVEWMVNRAEESWLVTLINPFGDLKPQQGIFPTDFRENRTVRIRSQVAITAAWDRLLKADRFEVKDNQLTVEVPAGGVRIIELR
ncbi:MAG: hypothetical protein HYU36_11115 [Planctomycetes bacterium]|nr:hypothetical protein [Planctomycetota bacterium]